MCANFLLQIYTIFVAAVGSSMKVMARKANPLLYSLQSLGINMFLYCKAYLKVFCKLFWAFPKHNGMHKCKLYLRFQINPQNRHYNNTETLMVSSFRINIAIAVEILLFYVLSLKKMRTNWVSFC